MDRAEPADSRRAGPEAHAEPGELGRRARVLLQMRRPREALAILQEITREQPEEERAWCLVSQAFSALEDGERGLRAAEFAIAVDPYATGGHVWKCRHLLALGRSAQALKAAREAMERTCSDPEIRRLLVRAFLACRRSDEARSELELLAQQFPDDPEIACLRGEIALARNNLPEAETSFRLAADRDPDCDAAWAGLGEVRKRGGRAREAVECFYQAARASPMKPEYRREVVELIDGLLEKQASVLPTLFYTAVLTVGFCFMLAFPVVIIAVVGLMVLGGKAIHAGVLGAVLQPMRPEVGAYYRIAKPLQKREDAGYLRWGCGFLVAVGGLIAGVVQLTRHALLETTLRVLLISALVGPWLWRRVVPRRPKIRRHAVDFHFPDDPGGAGEEAGEPAAPTPSGADPYQIAWAQLWSGEPAAARETARQILCHDAEDTSALTVLSLACLVAGDSEEALAAAQQARTLDPDRSDARALVWLNLAAAGRLDAAVGEAEEDPETVEDSLDKLEEMVGALRAGGAPEAARAGAELLQRIAGHSAQALALAGDQAYAERRWAEAEAAYRRALSLEPESARYLNNLGITVSTQRRYREAWSYWNQALRLDPNARWAVTNLEGAVAWVDTLASWGLTLALGLAALLPTFVGQPRNVWMPWATFAGPFLVAALDIPIHWLALRWIAPVLARGRSPASGGWFDRVFTSVLWSTLLLLPMHAFQGWLEIALHPGLLALRWPGAGTITFLAVYAWALVIAGWSRAAQEKAR